MKLPAILFSAVVTLGVWLGSRFVAVRPNVAPVQDTQPTFPAGSQDHAPISLEPPRRESRTASKRLTDPLPADANAVPPQRRFLADESRDDEWASKMEATLDSVVRSMGGPVRDVRQVECLSTQCRVQILYHPWVFLLEEAEYPNFTAEFFKELDDAMKPVFNADQRLSTISGAPFVRMSWDEPFDPEHVSDSVGASLILHSEEATLQ